MRAVQAQHVPAYIGRSRYPGEFWWISDGGPIHGMAAACPCGCGSELRLYRLNGMTSYPSFSSVVQCSRGSQWMLQGGKWLSAGVARQVPEPMF